MTSSYNYHRCIQWKKWAALIERVLLSHLLLAMWWWQAHGLYRPLQTNRLKWSWSNRKWKASKRTKAFFCIQYKNKNKSSIRSRLLILIRFGGQLHPIPADAEREAGNNLDMSPFKKVPIPSYPDGVGCYPDCHVGWGQHRSSAVIALQT